MAKCPNCNAEVDHLVVERDECAILHFTADGDYRYIESKDAGQQQEFYCPTCRSYLTTDEEEARAILRGGE